MRLLEHLFESNRAWASRVSARDPGFFAGLSAQQTPKYLWVGCADSRVPANEIVGLKPGELFVHRNVANVVVHSDLNCLSVLQYAVEVLKVEHVIVCGHYGCGGVRAALKNLEFGLIDNWLRHVQDVMQKYVATLAAIEDEAGSVDKRCEVHGGEQVRNESGTTIGQSAWRRGQELAVHGWVYGLHDGLLRDLAVRVTGQAELNAAERRPSNAPA